MTEPHDNTPNSYINPVMAGTIRDSIMNSVSQNLYGVTPEEVINDVMANIPQTSKTEVEIIIDYLLKDGSLEKNGSLLMKRRFPMPGLPLDLS